METNRIRTDTDSDISDNHICVFFQFPSFRMETDRIRTDTNSDILNIFGYLFFCFLTVSISIDRCMGLPIGAGRYQRNGRGLPQKSKTPFLIPAEITFCWPQNLGKGWMPKATAIIYPPRVQADQTNLLMHAALKLKVLINLHLGKRVPNDEDLPESFRVLVREL